MSTNQEILRLCSELAAAARQDRKVLATIESRIMLIHDQVRRSAEAIARLKLTADNAKRLALAQTETLEAIREHLDIADD